MGKENSSCPPPSMKHAWITILLIVSSSAQMPLCADGVTRAVAACFPNMTCNNGYTCESATKYCCPSKTPTTPPPCADGSKPIASCVKGVCGSGFTCVADRNICCKMPNPQTGTCQNGNAALSSCQNGTCPPGARCDPQQLCCAVCANSQGQPPSCATSPCQNGLICSTAKVCCPAPAPVPAALVPVLGAQ
eukprot:c5574_g1_i1.p1 GENE.c5574_g1_i1~~c5574_g1_i1.p1  ORF type:complete len:191 (-),score=33.15 c5574_g1_i1:175-747(-)